MKLNKIFKLTLGGFFAIPASFFLGGEVIASHFSDSVEPLMHNENHLLACGGGGGGGGNKPGVLKTKKLNSKLNFKKRKLSKAAAAGEDTSSLQAEIKELEAAIAEVD